MRPGRPWFGTYPELKNMDLVRFTLDIEEPWIRSLATVDSVFGGADVAAPAAT